MKVNSKITILGGFVAIILATACCWFPFLLISIGAGTGLVGLAEGLENYSNVIMGGGGILILLGSVQMYKRSKKKSNLNFIPDSTIICPFCDHSKNEIMPTNACQYFYECESCKNILRPIEGDCCVFCSYGDMDCPPIQTGDDCC